ncbi:MAG TPA: gluconokinase [Terriglobales bacterium]|nr:gluconokinase [Terriglobales bacterium]
MIILIMGVAGSGKTTVGEALAAQLGWEFADADDYHPAANVAKMASGIPLTDEDRAPWLDRLRELILSWITANKNGVLACSALKQAYRDRLEMGPEVRVVYLKGARELFRERLLARHGHYMRESMLNSQLATLEEPSDAIVVEADAAVERIVADILEKLQKSF